MGLIAFRTDAELEDKLERAALRQKKTKTAVIREALEMYLAENGDLKRSAATGLRLADVLKDDIGVWEGPATASSDTGKQLGGILLENYRTRRV
jgi:hypothetical protein